MSDPYQRGCCCKQSSEGGKCIAANFLNVYIDTIPDSSLITVQEKALSLGNLTFHRGKLGNLTWRSLFAPEAAVSVRQWRSLNLSSIGDRS